MATLAAAAIIQAVRDVIEDAHGSVRTIADGTYEPGVYEQMTSRAEAMQALGSPRAEVAITSVARHEASPPPQGSFQLLALELEVRVVRPFALNEALDNDDRAALRAVAAADGDVLQQALCWPGNLSQTAAGTSTGLVSGMLRYDESDVEGLDHDDDMNGRLVTTHRFTATARVALAIS
jgi:hypothetical protein